MCANGSPGATSPSKVRNVGRMASSRRLSVTAMSRMGCAPGAIRSQTPIASNSRRAAATIADARGSPAPRSSAGSATITRSDPPSACRKAIASDSPAKPAPAIRMSTCLLPSLVMVVRVVRRCLYQMGIDTPLDHPSIYGRIHRWRSACALAQHQCRESVSESVGQYKIGAGTVPVASNGMHWRALGMIRSRKSVCVYMR